MMQMDDQLVDAVKDIEDQHKGMQKIEQGVREIQELFQDMAVLVDLQQETLDVIERNVQDTAKYTREAEKNITQAEVYQKNSRKVNGRPQPFCLSSSVCLCSFLFIACRIPTCHCSTLVICLCCLIQC
jgi:t-SNARE complex subunit (syntaxin)